MRHRFKLWKYNSYNADEAEAMLNQMEGDIIGHFSVYCSLLAPILWLSGTCFALTADRKWLRVTGTLLSAFGYLGGLMGMAYIGLQLGLIS